MEQLSQKQRRRSLIKSLLQLKDAKEIEREKQKQFARVSQKHIENVSLEVQIKQFDCQQIQSYSDIKLYEKIFCKYNLQNKNQFLCCSKYCNNHRMMCGEQTCKCTLDHRKCTFISIESFRDQIVRKTQQTIPKQIELYFQAKSVIYEHMANRISQQRQALMDWQQDLQNNSVLFLYVSKVDQPIVCRASKVAYKKIHSDHQKCCVPIQIRKNDIKENKQQILKAICKNIHKKYSLMIEYFEQKLDQLQYYKKCANLNSAEFIFIDFLKNMNAFLEKSESKELDTDEDLKDMKIVTGRAIYFARKYDKKRFQNIDLEKFSINKIRRIWKGYSEQIFRSFVEGKAINELFYQTGKLGLLKIHSVQDLRSSLDKIIQSISQGQEHLFSKSFLTKKLVLKNLQQKEICAQLKKYKGNEVKEIQISNNRQRLVRYGGAKFDQVCISNDRFSTALNDIETIKQLGNLKNVTKLEIKWCGSMKAQVSMEILNALPHLKQLALIDHCRKLSQNFMKKLCQFKQLTLFYINSNSHPQYYRSFNEDKSFIGYNVLEKENFPSIKELAELSKLLKLENIEISQVDQANSVEVIKNMKSLRHLTLGYDRETNDEVHTDLMKQLCEKRALITLSLVGVIVESKQLSRTITNNPFLKTIIIRNSNNNEYINNGTVECMANLIQLQNLCIIGSKGITGKHLSKFDKLIMLEISNCPKVSKKEMKEALTKMQKLQHLNVNINKWFDDQVITSVQFCKNLTYLNIYATSVSWQGLKHLKGLTCLNILICGYTKINGKNLIELTKQTTRITRLNIDKLDVNNNDLLSISANCQALTHLKIADTKIATEALLKIKQLKVVFSYLVEDQKKKLRDADIQAY